MDKSPRLVTPKYLVSIKARRAYWDRRAEKKGLACVLPSTLNKPFYIVNYYNSFLLTAISYLISQYFGTANLNAEINVIDIGGGYGRVAISIALASSCFKVTVVDFSPQMQLRARAYATAMAVKDQIKVLSGEASQLTLNPKIREGTFNLAILGTVMLHIVSEAEFQAALRQAVKVLVTGGFLLIFEPMTEQNPQYQNLPLGMKHSYTRIRSLKDYKLILGKTGKLVEKKYVNFLDEVYTLALWQKA